MTERRAVPEWIGKTPDTKVPDHVRLRIWNTHKGVCHIAQRKIMAGENWDLDHVIALANGGEHRESNLAPALRDKHREKTALDVAEKAKIDGRQATHIGSRNKGPGSLQGRGFPKKPKKLWRSATELARMNAGSTQP
jgi:5-methylcytosine-specific restriction protein A